MTGPGLTGPRAPSPSPFLTPHPVISSLSPPLVLPITVLLHSHPFLYKCFRLMSWKDSSRSSRRSVTDTTVQANAVGCGTF